MLFSFPVIKDTDNKGNQSILINALFKHVTLKSCKNQTHKNTYLYHVRVSLTMSTSQVPRLALGTGNLK